MTPEKFLESKGIDIYSVVCYHFPGKPKDKYRDDDVIDIEQLLIDYNKATNDSKPVLDELIEKWKHSKIFDYELLPACESICDEIINDLKGLREL